MKPGSYKRIVTHPGGAHRDDFLSCAIAVVSWPEISRIDRREPTQKELEDDKVLVLDIGEVLEPAKGNFDHHQLPKEGEALCTLSLLLAHLGLVERFNLMDWPKATAIMDDRGPMALATHLGCSIDAIFKNLSPIEGSILEGFGKEREVLLNTATDFMGRMLKQLGKDILSHADKLHEQNEWLRKHAEIYNLDGLQVLFVDSTNVAGVQKFRDERCPEVAACVSRDDRGEGWALYRFNDHPSLDFAKLTGCDDVVFAHLGGFLAKTKKMEIGAALALVLLALR